MCNVKTGKSAPAKPPVTKQKLANWYYQLNSLGNTLK